MEYRRLPGRGRTLFSHGRAWIGPDHVLGIASRGYSEEYKRFYFKDIQAITIRQTSSGLIQNIILLAFTLLWGILAFRLGDEGRFFFIGLMVLFLLMLAYNVFRGPTAVCHIQTAVQTEKLLSLNRIRVAAKAVELLRPHIEKAQGRMELPELMAGYRALPVQPSEPDTSREIHHEPGHYHLMLCMMLVVDGCLTLIDFHFDHPLLIMASTIVAMVTTITVVAALVKQHDSDLPTGLKGIAWTSLAFVFFSFAYGLVTSMIVSISHPDISGNYWALMETISRQSPGGEPALIWLYRVSAAWSLSLAGLGLVFLARRQQAYRQMEEHQG